MNPTPLLAALALAFLLAQSSPRGDDDVEPLARGLGVPLAAATPLEPLGPGEAGRLAAATGREAGELVTIGLWEALATDERALRVARRAVAGGGKEGSVLLALTGDGEFAGAAVLDGDGAPLEEWVHFLDAFRFYAVPRIEGARPRAHLEQVRAESREGSSEEARQRYAMLELLVAMNAQAEPFNIPQASKTRTPAEESLAMATAYERVAELADGLGGVLGAKQPVFVDTALESADLARELAAATGAEDAQLVRELRGALVANCKTCHQLELPDGRGPLKDALPGIRAGLGIGDGFYQLGHDVRIRHADRERAQRVADALREAALALDLAAAR